MAFENKIMLGRILVEKGLLTEAGLASALEEQRKSGELLGAILFRLGLLTEAQLLQAISGQFQLDQISLKDVAAQEQTLARLPAKFAGFYRVFPVSYEQGCLTLATAHPQDVKALDDLQTLAHCPVRFVLAAEKDIEKAIREHYGMGAATIEGMMSDVEPVEEAVAFDRIDEAASDASISSFLQQMVVEAFRRRATDIHIEPGEGELRVRYRIDGVMYDARAPENIRFFQDALAARIKVLSGLNIAERRLPQDGRFKIVTGKDELDLRVSFLPTPFGESVVIRILNTRSLYSLEDLGFPADDMELFDRLLNKPHGIIFVTGPTGSGKTTTLYACLSRVNRGDVKIITIEDPVEYVLKGLTQIQVYPQIGLTFAAGLRSMLRHDPDVMMVGEVRDAETAQITIQTALTGHLVFTTLHTNDAASSATRLMDMGIEPYLIASSVECFVAQRLVRKICPACRRRVLANSEVAMRFGVVLDNQPLEVWQGAGCEACQMTGFSGRMVIAEFLVLDDEIRSMIVNRSTSAEIKARAVRRGMMTLRQKGWRRVLEGQTTPEEVLRATQDGDYEAGR